MSPPAVRQLPRQARPPRVTVVFTPSDTPENVPETSSHLLAGPPCDQGIEWSFKALARVEQSYFNLTGGTKRVTENCFNIYDVFQYL